MAFFVDPMDGNAIVVFADVDDARTRITSLADQETLFAHGHQFAAATARAAMVDGLALHYMLIAKQVRKVTFDQKTLDLLKDERITLGQIRHGLSAAGAFHDAGLESALKTFVKDRNHITHKMASGTGPFDLQAFFDLGRVVSLGLWSHTRGELAKLKLPA